MISPKLARSGARVRTIIPPRVLFVATITVVLAGCVLAPPRGGPTAELLRPTEIVRSDDVLTTLNFNVPQAGAALLTVFNPAPPERSVDDILISLNGRRVLRDRRLRAGHDRAVRVTVRQGRNQIDVDFYGADDARLVIGVEAPADNVTLDSVAGERDRAGGPVTAGAVVTGLGLPVAGATVRFDVIDATTSVSSEAVALTPVGEPDMSGRINESRPMPPGTIAMRVARTDGRGIARTQVFGLEPGPINLVAAIPGSYLVDYRPQVVRRVSVFGTPNRIELRMGTRRALRFDIDAVAARDDVLSVRHRITAAEGDRSADKAAIQHVQGLRVVRATPVPGIAISGRRTTRINPIVEALVPGRYRVTTTVQLSGSSARAEVHTDVVVRAARDRGGFELNSPMLNPLGVAPGADSATVTVRARVTGRQRPAAVFLEEVDRDGKVVATQLAALRDDGAGTDEFARDGIYSATIELLRDEPVERFFRIGGIPQVGVGPSRATPFQVTPFPTTARASDPARLVADPGKRHRVFSNEIVALAESGLRPPQMSDIAAEVGGTVVGVNPVTRQYLIEFPGIGTAAGVSRAAAVVAQNDLIIDAGPNHEVLAQMIPAEADVGNSGVSMTPCTASASNCQWHLEGANIEQAWTLLDQWNRPMGGTATRPVAVLEPGGVNGAHPELSGKCTVGTGAPATSCSGSSTHATRVAGLIAATADNPGSSVVGVAFDTVIRAHRLTSSYDLAAAVTGATAAVINISQDVDASIINTAIDNAINSDGQLVVAAAGNVLATCPTGDFYPAAYNGTGTYAGGLLAVGASNVARDIARWPSALPTDCSNSATWIDLFAPGEETYAIDAATAVSGTSIATPIVAGSAAVLLGLDPGMSASQVHDRIVNNTTAGTGALAGRPVLNLRAALEAPTNIAPSTLSIAEDCSSGVLVGAVATVDPTIIETFSYTFLNGGSEVAAVPPLQINSANGQITVVGGCPLDYETMSAYTRTVRSRDSTGLGIDRTITINVIDMPEIAPVSLSVNFELPSLAGSEECRIADPYSTPSVSFTIADNFGFADAVVGIVKNDRTSACTEPANVDQKLAVGRASFDSIGLSGFPIRMDFDTTLQANAASPAAIAAQFATGAGATARIRLFDAADNQVGIGTAVATPPTGTCGFPGTARARANVTATANSSVAYAIFDIPINSPSGGLVYTIDDVTVDAGP